MKSVVLKGEVGCNSKISSESIYFLKSNTTSTLLVSSLLNSQILSNYFSSIFLEMSAISFESVETNISLINLEFLAASIVQDIKGLPQKFFIFLLGNLLDPPLAVIRASII